MKTKLLTTAILTATLALPAFAEQPSFTYVEGGYTESDDDLSGFIVRGKAAITENLYLTGSYSLESDDEVEDYLGGDAEQDTLRVGIGANAPISDTTAVYGQIEYIDVSAEVDNQYFTAEASEDGYIASVGLRSMVADMTEVYGEIGTFDVVEQQTFASIGVRQGFTQNLGVFAEYTARDDDTSGYSVGVSVKF